MHESVEVQPCTLQRFPPELVYPIVLRLLADQLEDIVYGSSVSDTNDAYPALTLLHLCSAFRRCTTEVLVHMLGAHSRPDTSPCEIIPILRLYRKLSRAAGEKVKVASDLAENLKDLPSESLGLSPVSFVLGVYLHSQCHYESWHQENRANSEKVFMPEGVQNIMTVEVAGRYMDLPAWTRHVLLGRIVASCISLSIHVSRMFSLSRVALTLVHVLQDENIEWDTHEEIGRFIADAYAEDGYVCESLLRGSLKGHLDRFAKWGLDCTIPQFSTEDAEAAGVREAFEMLMRRVQQGHIRRVDGRTIRDALPLYACMAKEEVEALKTVLDMSILDEPELDATSDNADDHNTDAPIASTE